MFAKYFAKPLLWVFTSAFPVFIAACYGVYQDLADGGTGGERRATGTVKDAGNGQGIGGILISCMLPGSGDGGAAYDETYSLSGDGHFEIWYPENQPCESLRFEDVDGADNGGEYAGKTIAFDQYGGEIDVELELED